MRDSIGQAGRAALPLVNAAFDEPERLESLDLFCDGFLSYALHDLEQQSTALCGHLAPLFGAATRALDCARPDAQQLFLHVTARSVLSAAVRLGIIGPYAAQHMQADCVVDFERVLSRCGQLTECDVAQTAPLIDVVQGTHDRLFEAVSILGGCCASSRVPSSADALLHVQPDGRDPP